MFWVLDMRIYFEAFQSKVSTHIQYCVHFIEFVPGKHRNPWSTKPSSQKHMPSRHKPAFSVPVHCEEFTQDWPNDRLPAKYIFLEGSMAFNNFN